MGVPRLRQHLGPFSQTVLLQNEARSSQEDITCIASVVIDGPSLVHNIYSRLLSWFCVSKHNVIDTLPTCDEVSRGVIIFLTHLNMLGVDIKGVYFDGALPAQKHDTRLARLENQRRRLEYFCAATKTGFVAPGNQSYDRIIRPEHLLRSRPSHAKCSNAPINPFMVPTVLEDLEYRWNKDYTARITEGILPVLDSRSPAWAKLSTIVPGEADAYCAYAARLTGCCILTNDSDLLLYDLGDNGSVVFLDSIELSVWDSGQPLQSQMKATMLRPSETAERLRISSLLPLAYELQTHPELGLVDLLRRSRSLTTMPGPSEYQQFVAEYQINNNEQDIVERPLALFDTRISELCYQYQPTCEGACTRAGNYPHMYLPILIEDHSRRCAWVNGHLYRKAAYSLLNVARPYSERHCYVTEFIRRGQRIVEDRTQLCDEGWISAQLKSLSVRLASLRADLGADNGSLEYWTIFALYEVYSAGIRFDHHHIPRLQRFISLGYMGRRLEWADIHLTAQTHAVLYSLRILKQLLSFSSPDDAIALHVKKTLESLPPLHVITKPIYQRGKQCTADISATRLSGIFEFAMVSGRSEHTEETTRHELHPHCSATARTVQGGANDDARPLKNLSNIFELLQEQ